MKKEEEDVEEEKEGIEEEEEDVEEEVEGKEDLDGRTRTVHLTIAISQIIIDHT